MSLLWIIREQNLLLLLIAQLTISLFLIYYEKNKFSYVVEIMLIIGNFALNNSSIDIKVLLAYVVEYILMKVILVLIIWLAKHFAFYVLVVISHKKKRLYKFFIKKKRFLKVQSKIWNKVDYGIRIKKGIPAMVGKRNDKTGVYFDNDGFPKFKSIATIKLSMKFWRKSRNVHFYQASKTLYKKIKKSSSLSRKFTKKEISEFEKGEVPSKYTWHHHQDKGVLELVEYKIHSEVRHRGGFAIWGGCK